MEFIIQLWLPIVVSAVLVFVASSLVHMVIKWHTPDYRPLPDEAAARAALKGAPAGQYLVPFCSDMKDMGSPEMVRKFQEGPIGILLLREPCTPSMGKALGQWFAFSLVVSVIAAYVASRTPGYGATWGTVARITGGLAFLAYTGGYIQYAIWWGHPWRSVAKYVADGAIYAAIVGATFGSLWPR